MMTKLFQAFLLTSALTLVPLFQKVPSEAQPANYGPDTCLQGYVWREAVSNDHVCVTPKTRSQAAYDNTQASRRLAGSSVPIDNGTNLVTARD